MTNLNKRRRLFNRLKKRSAKLRGIGAHSLPLTTSESELARPELELVHGTISASSTSTSTGTSTGYVGDAEAVDESGSSSGQSRKLSPPKFARSFSKGVTLSTTSSATSISTSTRSSAALTTPSGYNTASSPISYVTLLSETGGDEELSKEEDERNVIAVEKDEDADDVRVVLSEIVTEVVVRQQELSNLKERQNENELSYSEC